jgi:fumarylacetoacetase
MTTPVTFASAHSWVDSASAPGCDFSLDNLPFCAFESASGEVCLGVGIGDLVFNLRQGVACTSLSMLPAIIKTASAASFLNELMLCGAERIHALRCGLHALFAATASKDDIATARPLLSPISTTRFCLPVDIGNYTDFYASIHHATNVGRLFRPDQPLLPNYKFVPIGYHGRASSIQVSGTAVTRPSGQLKAPDTAAPVYAPCRQLDYEIEMGAYIGVGNPLGHTIPIEHASQHIFGLSLLNDWSARDIQSWEYQPLGPFLSKSFMTTVSPWVVPAEALAPYRVAVAKRPPDDPEPLPYLSESEDAKAAYDIQVEVHLLTQAMRAAGLPPRKLTAGNAKDLYWSFAQMVTHHASNGCNLMPGDLIGSGTISGQAETSSGSLLELTRRGSMPLQLGDGESRTFLEDGDEVIFRGFCERPGLPRIGFGECRGMIQPPHGGGAA